MSEQSNSVRRVLVALSGGVDSSVCVKLLKEQGYAVEAAVIRFSPAHESAVQQACVVAAQLQIPIAVLNGENAFTREVVEPFCRAYCSGTTPNPCILCNPRVKFRLLCEYADRVGIQNIATGHYARIANKQGVYYVQKAVSEARDQSYMLYRLPQNVLSRLLLPLGEMEKPAVRKIASNLSLASADAPDSQEICFIPDGDYTAFIEQRGLQGALGRFIGPDGQNLGPHKGVLYYTVGQRRGLHIALGKPVFVKKIGADGNIFLGYAGEEFYSSVRIIDSIKTDGTSFAVGEEYTVKIRSAAKPVPCSVAAVQNEWIELSFEAPVRAPAPGQAAVLYCGDLVVGGGCIAEIY